MRSLRILLFPTVLLSTLLLPATGMAAWTHSWCIPGGPLVLPAPAGTNTNLVKIVNNICGGYADCCSSDGRWSLACVQRAAAYAKQNNLSVSGSSDYCGRYAWNQGPVSTSSTQYYPRDFNLFALGGDVSGFADVEGPIAASGNVKTSGFAVNSGRSETSALVAKGSVDLASGTVSGYIDYGTTYTDHGTVKLVDAQDPNRPAGAAVKNATVIDFATANTLLTQMSTQVNLYNPAIKATTLYNAVTFSGTDKELNVFSLDSGLLTNATSYVFDVPQGSAVIINVSGTTPSFMNAKFSGLNGAVLPISVNKILWNFPKATSLTIQSVGFLGSILAPGAAATFKWASFMGTAVVKSLSSTAEVYMARYQIPGPGGCLWADSSWSCSNDTTLDDSQHAAAIAAEAGFFEIQGEDYIAEGVTRTSPTHRIWYSFQPAWPTPKDMPLVVFFNGGPGAATSSLLFSFNTGNWTLDPHDPGVAASPNKIASNPNSWTKFANLLYIDAPATGFSYPRPYNGKQQNVGIDIDRDAGIFLSVVTRFLIRHPMVQYNPVILGAESYGGIRGTLMLNYLYRYATLQTGAYQDTQVYADLGNYFNAVFSTTTPAAKQIATRFSNQVLIDPGLAGMHQLNEMYTNSNCAQSLPACVKQYGTSCPSLCYQAAQDPITKRIIQPQCDPYNCDMPNTLWPVADQWGADLETTAIANLNIVANLNKALGVDARTIEWMKAANRTDAYGREDGTSSTDMVLAFGDLLSNTDSYFVQQNSDVFCGYYGCGAPAPTPKQPWTPLNHARQWDDYPPYGPDTGADTGADFLNNVLNGTAAFITVAKYDAVIESPSAASGLDDVCSAGQSVVYNATTPTDIPARPGAALITYSATQKQSVTMPTSYNSGHTVSMRAPADLLADVLQWYTDSTHLGPPYKRP